MVQTFILTRSFAISALVASAFPVTYAAPIQRPNIVVHQARGNYPRGCRLMGCLYALPTGQNTNTAATESTSTPSSDDSLGVIDLLISALTSARNSLASTSSTATNAVTVDAVVDPATSSAEDLIESLASAAEASSAPTVVESAVPAVEVTPVESEAASLDALV
ncbi:hypothetical protein LXA43DRAFT_1094742 [Ganoderma leucocontextum]|nr:hypothetical protein LXA43DRAFT_1094742 [Ganoderma leucocontextum]